MNYLTKLLARLPWFLVALALMGCNLKLDTDVGVLPGLKGEMPKSSGPEVSGTANPTQVSQSNSTQGTKTPIMNLIISNGVHQATGMHQTLNCAQLVQFDSGTVVVDFSPQSCPSQPDEPLSASAIKFTLTYQEVGGGGYELQYQGGAVGLMKIDFEGPSVTLESLCSAGYSSRCFLSTVGSGRVDGLFKF